MSAIERADVCFLAGYTFMQGSEFGGEKYNTTCTFIGGICTVAFFLDVGED
jgi:hypothetical protein